MGENLVWCKLWKRNHDSEACGVRDYLLSSRASSFSRLSHSPAVRLHLTPRAWRYLILIRAADFPVLAAASRLVPR
jgi:hypothetical protein